VPAPNSVAAQPAAAAEALAELNGVTAEEYLAQKAAELSIKQAKKLTEKEIAKRCGCKIKDIHKLKDLIKKQFQKELQKAGIKNPDIAVDKAGNLVLQQPGQAANAIPTGIPMTSFAP